MKNILILLFCVFALVSCKDDDEERCGNCAFKYQYITTEIESYDLGYYCGQDVKDLEAVNDNNYREIIFNVTNKELGGGVTNVSVICN